MRIYKPGDRCNISGLRVKEARKKAKLSQGMLAARLQVRGLQVEQMAISRIETGLRVVADFELPILADALDVTVEWLLGLTD
ncbi:MAG: helix-turn-helix domain-containing protein [Oscillospiraceae bacterium]|nr:helix-turn-helix domain-containing protein [Oscillospiraceae bacterium]